MAESPPTNSEALEQVASWVRQASCVVVLTGAGVSAESGQSTFRDPEQGLWARYDPMELATAGAFERDPELVTRWYQWRFTKAKEVQPNPGHHALATMEQWLSDRPDTPARFTLLTQNVDGLHQRAGSRRVIELHGSILRWRCTRSGQELPLEALSFETLPIRSEAGGLMRPCVVWFGECLPADALDASGEALATMDASSIFFSIGTSGMVYPAAGFVQVAKASGARVVEINREPTPLAPHADAFLQGASGQILPALVALI